VHVCARDCMRETRAFVRSACASACGCIRPTALHARACNIRKSVDSNKTNSPGLFRTIGIFCISRASRARSISLGRYLVVRAPFLSPLLSLSRVCSYAFRRRYITLRCVESLLYNFHVGEYIRSRNKVNFGGST